MQMYFYTTKDKAVNCILNNGTVLFRQRLFSASAMYFYKDKSSCLICEILVQYCFVKDSSANTLYFYMHFKDTIFCRKSCCRGACLSDIITCWGLVIRTINFIG